MGDNSPRTDTSTDMEGDAKLDDGHHLMTGGSNTSDHDHEAGTKNGDSKALRRLAQNREAARKSRLRKKAYVQQLESSRIKLNQLEQELQRARQQQGLYLGPGSYSGDQNAHSGGAGGANANNSAGAAAFDMEYARWVEEQHRQMSELRAALQAHVADTELRVLVDGGMAHYDDIFRLKAVAAKADVFHLVSGMWKTPAERCFMWMGGFRPSELLKILIPQIEPLTEQQLLNICNLQQSSQQAEDALSQGMEALQQSLADTLSAGSLGSSPNVANYMGQMAMAMGKLGSLETFVRQADSLRQQTLQQMHRILTTRQAARGLLAMGYEDVLGASVAATAVNNPDKLPSSNCTNCQRDFISDEALVMKGCEGGRVLLQGPGVAWLYACDIGNRLFKGRREGRAMKFSWVVPPYQSNHRDVIK